MRLESKFNKKLTFMFQSGFVYSLIPSVILVLLVWLLIEIAFGFIVDIGK